MYRGKIALNNSSLIYKKAAKEVEAILSLFSL
jgi:hypothetical protein